MFFQGTQRGIYVGFTGNNSKEFMIKKVGEFKQDKLESTDLICLFWKIR